MRSTRSILAAAIAALAFAAVPAFASAAVEVDYPGTNGHFTVSGGAAKLTSDSDSFSCTSVTGTGTFENKTTGHIELTFHGCKEELGFNCTGSGQSTGTITTTNLGFHVVSITSGKPGILITPTGSGSTAHFASFVCGGFIPYVWRGNGIIGEITAPACNTSSHTFTVKFTGATPAPGTKQTHTTIDGSSTEYGLEASVAGGGLEEVSEDAEATGTFTEGTEEGEITGC